MDGWVVAAVPATAAAAAALETKLDQPNIRLS